MEMRVGMPVGVRTHMCVRRYACTGACVDTHMDVHVHKHVRLAAVPFHARSAPRQYFFQFFYCSSFRSE